MAIKRVELESGCFAKAKDDEPMFVLLSRDASAPWLVRAWAFLRKWQVYLGFKPPSDLDKVDEASLLARRMRSWRRQSRTTWRDGERPYRLALALWFAALLGALVSFCLALRFGDWRWLLAMLVCICFVRGPQ